MDKKSLLKNLLLFAVVFLLINALFKGCNGTKTQDPVLNQGTIGISTTKTTYSRAETVTVTIQNNTDTAIVIPSECPKEPLNVTKYTDGEWKQIESTAELKCEGVLDYTIEPGKKLIVAYDKWNHSLFSSMGRFKIATTINVPVETAKTDIKTDAKAVTQTTTKSPVTKEQKFESKTFETNEFTVVEEGMFKKLWTGILYRPIYNILMFLIAMIPGHNLGLAIIILTLIVRTILLAPSQKAMRAQRKMQMIQPMLESIKEKHKGDQQRIAQETMNIWKTHKVSPMGSCLPLLLQFPVLIALFYVVQKGLNPDNAYMLYTTYAGFSLTDINTSFFGLDLLKKNMYVLPVIVGLLTFAQMKLSTHVNKKKDEGKKGEPKKINEMAMTNNIMSYFMPVMVAVFTASLPAGVGVYWATSTLYGVIQQFFANKSKPGKDKNNKKDTNEDVKVRVIESK